jgi:hypothetical protein
MDEILPIVKLLRIIHWCDAKMMYGSSTIPSNNKCAVENLENGTKV